MHHPLNKFLLGLKDLKKSHRAVLDSFWILFLLTNSKLREKKSYWSKKKFHIKKIIIKLNKLQASPTSKMDGTRLPSTPWPLWTIWTLENHVSYLTEHLQYRFTQLPWILLHSAQQVSTSKMHRRGILKSAVNNNTTGNKRTAVQPACYHQPQCWAKW